MKNIFKEDKEAFKNLLKTELHIHTKEDKLDKVKYTSKELIDFMHSKGFNVLSFTFHDQAFADKETIDYAKTKGILLIPGTERKIEKKEVLIYAKNTKILEETPAIKTFEDLKEFRERYGEKILIIAAHPFFIRRQCLGRKFTENIDLFDAVEYSHFYTKLINRNNPAVEIAEKNNLPIIGNSDIHLLSQAGLTYSRINAKKDIASIFQAIRNSRIKVITKPLSLIKFIKIMILSFFF